MVADGLIKPLGKEKQSTFVEILRLISKIIPWN
jgi:hypothetical protein